jgi:hypothetical protein
MLCSPGMLEDFKKSSIWEDMVSEINTRIEIRRLEMEDPDGMLTVDDLRRAQGGIKAYKEIRDNLLESLIEMSSETSNVKG